MQCVLDLPKHTTFITDKIDFKIISSRVILESDSIIFLSREKYTTFRRKKRDEDKEFCDICQFHFPTQEAVFSHFEFCREYQVENFENQGPWFPEYNQDRPDWPIMDRTITDERSGEP